MHIADGRNEALFNTAKPGPRQAVSLTSADQRMSLSATNFAAHPCQTIQITRHSVVVEIPLNHAV